MSSSEIGLLQANLVELYRHFSHSKGRLSDLCVSYGNRICHRYSYLNLVDCLFGEAPSEEEVSKAIAYTVQDLFTKCMAQVYQDYQQRVVDCVRSIEKSESAPKDSLKEGEIDKIRETIVACNEATQFFWKEMSQSGSKEALAPLAPFLPDEFILRHQAVVQALKRAQCLMNLESILECEIPFVELAKWLDPSVTLSSTEQQRIEKWIKEINTHKKSIPLEDFREALIEIVRIINLQGKRSVKLDHLVLKMDAMKCDMFQEEEEEHMQWRETLKPGDKMTCNGQLLELDAELKGSGKIDDQYRVFALKGEFKHCVVVIAKNRFKLGLDVAKRKKGQWGIHPVKIAKNIGGMRSGLDKDGTCGVFAKLPHPLVGYKWTNTQGKLSPEDEEKALVIAHHVDFMRQRKSVPEDLSIEHLRFGVNKILTSTRLLKKGSFNYNLLEQFCVDVAQGCLCVLHFLMYKLKKHPIAQWYKEAVTYTFEKGRTNLILHVQPKKYKHPRYEQRVEELCAKALVMRKECFQKVRQELRRKGKHHYSEDEQLEKAVSEKLVECYLASPTPGILAPSLQEQVERHFSAEEKEEKKGGFILNSDMEAYYEAAFTRAMENSQAVLRKRKE